MHAGSVRKIREWVQSRVVQRAPGELADSKSMSGQLSPRSRRME